jgi:hypothetical protein
MGINITEILLCREWLEDAEVLVLISAMGVLPPDDSAICEAAALILIGSVIDCYTKKPLLFIGPRSHVVRTVDSFSESDCRLDFRIPSKAKLRDVLVAWRVPYEIRTANRCVFSGHEAFLMMMYRWAYPRRYTDMEHVFGRDATQICRAVNAMVTYMDHLHGPRIQNGLAFWQRRFVVWNESIRKTILDHGHVVPLHGVRTSAFYDCTVKQTTRITVGGVLMPLVIFDGHHRVNALKFGALVGPSCDIVDVSIGVEARVHDQRVEGEFSDLDARFGQCQDNAGVAPGDHKVYYKDKGFFDTPHAYAAHHGPHLTALEAQENAIMRAPRAMAAENFFNIVDTQWKLLELHCNNKIMLSDVSVWYRMSCLFSQTRSCLENNTGGEYFSCRSPTLGQFFEQPLCNY